jgi:hypothetical protein
VLLLLIKQGANGLNLTGAAQAAPTGAAWGQLHRTHARKPNCPASHSRLLLPHLSAHSLLSAARLPAFAPACRGAACGACRATA